MANALKQTLRVASGVVFALTEITPTVTAVQGTVATMADGSDITGSSITAADDVDMGVGGASGSYREEWTLEPATVVGDIAFIRIVARTNRVGSPVPAITAEYQPSIQGVVRGVSHFVTGLSEDVQEFTTDPADGLPWTLAKINAQRFGWFIEAGAAGAPLTLDAVCTCSVVDFLVELWGPDFVGTVEIAGAIDVVGDGAVGNQSVAGALDIVDAGVLSSPVTSAGPIDVAFEGKLEIMGG